MLVFWAVAAGAFLVLEAVTVAMTSIWFAAGCLVALLAAALSAPLWLQIVLFVAVSAACFLLLYPRLKNYLKQNKHATNADASIGKIAVVSETIDNLAATGTVQLEGKTWSARSQNGEIIPAGARAQVQSIQGVKLIVSTFKSNES